jgi:hypothetical protein
MKSENFSGPTGVSDFEAFQIFASGMFKWLILCHHSKNKDIALSETLLAPSNLDRGYST